MGTRTVSLNDTNHVFEMYYDPACGFEVPVASQREEYYRVQELVMNNRLLDIILLNEEAYQAATQRKRRPRRQRWS